MQLKRRCLRGDWRLIFMGRRIRTVILTESIERGIKRSKYSSFQIIRHLKEREEFSSECISWTVQCTVNKKDFPSSSSQSDSSLYTWMILNAITSSLSFLFTHSLTYLLSLPFTVSIHHSFHSSSPTGKEFSSQDTWIVEIKRRKKREETRRELWKCK